MCGSPLTQNDPAASDHVRRCRACGCTDERACPGGCWWVEDDLCSACAEPGAGMTDEQVERLVDELKRRPDHELLEIFDLARLAARIEVPVLVEWEA